MRRRRPVADRRWADLVLVAALAITACTGSEPEQLVDVDVAQSATSTSRSSATTASTSEPQPTTETTSIVDETDVNQIKAVWQEFIIAAATRTNPDLVAELSNTDVANAADQQFFDARDPQTFYTQIDIAGDTATIEDCSLFSQPLSSFFYIPLNGQATRNQDGEWKVTELTVNELQKCIPGDFAAEIYAVYEEYWDAQPIYRNPPDPTSPLITQLTTGTRTEKQLEVLDQQIEAGVGWHGRPTTHPEFFDFAPGKVLIGDCQLVDPESGLYDLETGERSDRFEEIVPDQRDRLRSRLEFTDGSWKVAELGATRAVDCEFAPTDSGVPIVGPLVPTT